MLISKKAKDLTNNRWVKVLRSNTDTFIITGQKVSKEGIEGQEKNIAFEVFWPVSWLIHTLLMCQALIICKYLFSW